MQEEGQVRKTTWTRRRISLCPLQNCKRNIT